MKSVSHQFFLFEVIAIEAISRLIVTFGTITE
jgi:hypothetical protein